jgi:hypothetical protein
MSANNSSPGSSMCFKSLSEAYQNEQSFSKAVNYAKKKALSNSPRKKRAVVQQLASQFSHPSNHAHNVQNNNTVVADHNKVVQKYYDHDTVSQMLPGHRDYVTVVEADGTRERVQKKILLLTVMEAFQIFKLE